jgi:hypothetical protein
VRIFFLPARDESLFATARRDHSRASTSSGMVAMSSFLVQVVIGLGYFWAAARRILMAKADKLAILKHFD